MSLETTISPSNVQPTFPLLANCNGTCSERTRGIVARMMIAAAIVLSANIASMYHSNIFYTDGISIGDTIAVTLISFASPLLLNDEIISSSRLFRVAFGLAVLWATAFWGDLFFQSGSPYTAEALYAGGAIGGSAIILRPRIETNIENVRKLYCDRSQPDSPD